MAYFKDAPKFLIKILKDAAPKLDMKKPKAKRIFDQIKVAEDILDRKNERVED